MMTKYCPYDEAFDCVLKYFEKHLGSGYGTFFADLETDVMFGNQIVKYRDLLAFYAVRMNELRDNLEPRMILTQENFSSLAGNLALTRFDEPEYDLIITLSVMTAQMARQNKEERERTIEGANFQFNKDWIVASNNRDNPQEHRIFVNPESVSDFR